MCYDEFTTCRTTYKMGEDFEFTNEEEEMEMRSKRWLALGLSVATIFSLTACGTTNNSGGGNDAAKTETTTAASGTTTAAAKEEAGSGEEEVAGFGQKDPESYVADLKFMVHSDGQPTYMIKKFNEVYPNIHIELVMVPGAEQQEKILTMVNGGEDIADLFTCRTQFVKAIVNNPNCYMDLSAEPFNAGEWTDQIEDYVVGVGTDTNGSLRALSWQCPVGGVFYRRSMAKEYFGTDDPVEIGKLFSSYESMIDAARTVKEKSGGQVYFNGNAVGDLSLAGMTGAGGYLLGNKLNTGEKIVNLFEYCKTMYDENLTGKCYKNDAGIVSLTQENKVFSLMNATWALNFNIMPNYEDQAGDWAVATPPETFTAGGTYVGISQATKYPEECYLFLKFILTNEDFVYDYATDFGDYVSNKAIQEKVGNMTTEEAAELKLGIFEYLNGQNAYAYWNSQLEKGVDSSAFSPYDEYFQNYMQAAMEAYAAGSLSLEEALAQYKSDCQNYAPSIEVE